MIASRLPLRTRIATAVLTLIGILTLTGSIFAQDQTSSHSSSSPTTSTSTNKPATKKTPPKKSTADSNKPHQNIQDYKTQTRSYALGTPKPIDSRGFPRANSALPLSSYAEFEEHDLAPLYYALSAKAPDYETIASIFSDEYRQTSNQFRKRDLFAVLRQQTDQRIQYFRNPARRYYLLVTDFPGFDHYNFETKSFPIFLKGVAAGEWFSTDRSEYHLDFTNGTKYLNLYVPDEQRARTLESQYLITGPGVFGYGSGTASIYLFVQAADRENTMIHCQIVKVILKDPRGNVIGEL